MLQLLIIKNNYGTHKQTEEFSVRVASNKIYRHKFDVYQETCDLVYFDVFHKDYNLHKQLWERSDLNSIP